MASAPYVSGDVVQMKKPHACGGDRWEIVRTGMDFRLKCQGCDRIVTLPRRRFIRGVKGKIVSM